ncbi:nucleotidyltransferase domain-containing protein [Pigmentiphaga aceris]|uniref:Nucleotidyltransferase domain-containing protein n=1 Tax=Pigmentiphaga aceris TaxID=1940612 RepID=A0A5C0B215_9BURK|nr:nucleotidyltransferase domain-containing protein [Pigmentiphaga aceris]QEI08869.1 nucleotidyltransferase domain-containing protein [Pigmentiphaga aceris]
MSAVDFMFAPPVQRILGATLLNPERSYRVKDLIALSGGGVGNTRRHLAKLISAGILEEDPRRGHERSIRINAAHFLYKDLQSIARKTFGLVEPVRDALTPFAKQIQQAFIFGSVVSGQDTADSDIDLIVVGHPDLILAVGESLLQAETVLGRRIHLSLYDEQEWAHLRQTDPVVSQILEGATLTVLSDGKTD